MSKPKAPKHTETTQPDANAASRAALGEANASGTEGPGIVADAGAAAGDASSTPAPSDVSAPAAPVAVDSTPAPAPSERQVPPTMSQLLNAGKTEREAVGYIAGATAWYEGKGNAECEAAERAAIEAYDAKHKAVAEALAARKAKPAPIEDTAKVAAAPVGEKAYRVSSIPSRGFRRIGRLFTNEPTTLLASKLTEEQQKQLLATESKFLRVEIING